MKSIVAALILAKSQFKDIHKNKVNPHFKSKYASLDLILEAITVPLSNAGLVLIQPTIIRDGSIVLSTQLIHAESGESIESELVIPAQSDPQKLGSALTYYRRFSICTLLAIAADDDDDGNTAANNSTKVSNPTPKPQYLVPTHQTPKAGIQPLITTIATIPEPSETEQYQADLKKAFEVLDWGKDRKIDWAKTINPNPFDRWNNADWQSALTKAYLEIDLKNQEG